MKRKLTVTVSRGIMPRKFSPFHISLTEEMEVNDDNREKIRKRTYNELKGSVDKWCEKVLDEEAKESED